MTQIKDFFLHCDRRYSTLLIFHLYAIQHMKLHKNSFYYRTNIEITSSAVSKKEVSSCIHYFSTKDPILTMHHQYLNPEFEEELIHLQRVSELDLSSRYPKLTAQDMKILCKRFLRNNKVSRTIFTSTILLDTAEFDCLS